MFRLNGAIKNAVTPRAEISKPQREIEQSLEPKRPITDIPSIISRESNRDKAKRSVESSKNHDLVMVAESRNDDQT